MALDKRYQVFVSSTFDDLQEERQEVIQALLELKCMPAGMELFPAANEDQWTLIKRVIDDCDYYVVIIAGRYGSLSPAGVGYTELEYRYALEQKKPIIAFLHKDVSSLSMAKSETDPEKRNKLENFRTLAKKKLVKFWSSASELGSVVSRSLVTLINNEPAIGWVKADKIPDEAASEQILRLKKQVEEMEAKILAARTTAPEGTDQFAQGEDAHTISYTFWACAMRGLQGKDCKGRLETTWNRLFFEMSPLMVEEASEAELKECINKFLYITQSDQILKQKDFQWCNEIRLLRIDDTDFQTIKVQFRALGLITKSVKARSVKDAATYWTLTPYGDAVMTRLRAIRKER